MKKISTLFLMMLVVFVMNTQAQRYIEEVFTDVEVTSGVTYGMNATVLYYNIEGVGEALPEALILDVYEPAGDTETNRPLILYFHTGNFLPHPQNQSPTGLRTDSAVVELCSRFARMGYVVASCDYRLGWNPIAPTQEERTYTLINAAYRGVQDSRTAARYFRMTEAEMDNPYGIDPTKVVVWGQGTGGYIAFATATINDYVTDIGINPKFQWDPDMDGNPQPMVLDFVNGDIYGTSYGINPLDMDTLAYPNWPGYTSDFSASVNMGGAMGDLEWLEDGSIPMISFHTPNDPFAPYEFGMVVVPVWNYNVVEVDGSYNVQEKLSGFGSNDVFGLLDGDNYSAAANTYNDGFYGLFPFNRPVATDSAPWEWWAPNNPNNANGLATNPDMSAEKGRNYCDSIQWYTAPRLACILNLPNNPCSGGVLNDACDLAYDLNGSIGGSGNIQIENGPYSNTTATVGNDPEVGWECWLEPDGNGDSPSLDNSVWFTFTGDGNDYNIFADDCGGDLDTEDYIELGDTQFALYAGDDCSNLVPVLCVDDSEDITTTNYFAEMDLELGDGITYYLLVDGFNYSTLDPNIAIADGEFCLQITNVVVGVDEIPQTSFVLFPNPANDRFTINAKENMETVEVFTALGQCFKVFDGLSSDILQVNTAHWDAGIYSVRIRTANTSATQTVVVE
ncbi:MAG: T9SS type A sorting domain-containing protein [Flavobacteriales bacterium]|nr:T9SS type A sorting domain-containing protein [Flavobacteriales bacterium]